MTVQEKFDIIDTKLNRILEFFGDEIASGAPQEDGKQPPGRPGRKVTVTEVDAAYKGSLTPGFEFDSAVAASRFMDVGSNALCQLLKTSEGKPVKVRGVWFQYLDDAMKDFRD